MFIRSRKGVLYGKKRSGPGLEFPFLPVDLGYFRKRFKQGPYLVILGAF